MVSLAVATSRSSGATRAECSIGIVLQCKVMVGRCLPQSRVPNRKTSLSVR